MHPYLIPWTFSGQTLQIFAYVGVVAAAAFLAWFMAVRNGGKPNVGKAVVVFAVATAVGAFLVATRLQGVTPQPLPLHTYGLMIALGFISAIHLSARSAEAYASVDGRAFYLPGAPALAAAREAAAKGGDAGAVSGRRAKDNVLDLAFWVLAGAMAGARALFIVVNWSGPDGYGAHPGRIFEIWTGGLVFYGGFIGAALASVVYARKHRIDFRGLADIAAPTVALGHFFGRMGCMAAGCCWGKVCDDPSFLFGAHFPEGSLVYDEMIGAPEFRSYVVEHGHTPALHPTQLYEGLGELGLFLLLIHLRRGKRFQGQILSLWLMLYALLRLSIETFRGDFGRGMLLRWPETDPLLLSTSQVVGVGMFALGAILYFTWRPKVAAPAGAGEPTAAAA
ncbi:prolipoprotein diacylglyceryl transferase [Vulgatibacter incomptus]|uniref:Phosphatidylglycerol--prolipoprotein diacylglyceryl transferase n=1 Tax=Vulgatibacter incomptus TaxID=1391653 RepID=A0A0K1PH27_9BACT|nr:prolipoprotein diacylglyceryl transferase [Vulgatibacter incomptus]AKU92825.1 Prolipoprotein diacylglyceryl transferase [Vulgatibacter incomptus]